MVNVGGPSKGCRTCIQRKIRCDRQRPTCGQCQKSTRECEGYRSDTDLIFVDQSGEWPVTQSRNKAKKSAKSAAPAQQIESSSETQPSQQVRPSASYASLNTEASDAVTSISAQDAEPNQSSPHPDIAIHSPKLDRESGLITFFANNFLCDRFRPGTTLFWVPDDFYDLIKHESAKLSILSVSAMALARLQGSPYYEREGQKNYGAALLSLAGARENDAKMDTDMVLITVLFLAFFEIIASFEGSTQSWGTHIEGLGTLLARRRKYFLRTDFGARMLLTSRSQAIVFALQTKTSVHEIFQQPDQRVLPSMPPPVILSERCDMLLIRLATLQHRCLSQGPSEVLVTDLTGLDNDLCQLIQAAPRVAAHSTQLGELANELWWETRHDVYSPAIMAHVWSKIRAARIVTHDLIEQASLHLSSSEAERIDRVTAESSFRDPDHEVRTLVTDICATVHPYYRPSTAFLRPDEDNDPPPIGTAYWLLWPIEVVGSMREAPIQLRLWVAQCLERVSHTTGVVKAQVVADRLKARLATLSQT